MRYLLCLAASIAVVCPLAADELSDARAALDGLGIKATSTGVVLAKEAELTKELNKSAGLKRNVLQAEKELKSAELQLENWERGLIQLRQQHIQLSAQLANIGPNDVRPNNVTAYNQLISTIKVTEGKFEQAKETKRHAEAEVKNSRAKANEAREAYISLAISTRKLADQIEEEYSTKAANADVKSALTQFNKVTGKQFSLAATPGFQANVRRLKQLEDTVLSESIDLHDDGSKTMKVGVVVNGRFQQEMMLDSGASLISLPSTIAAKFGLRPGEKDPEVTLELADGRKIPGRLMKLSSVRVGKFQVDNVECVVLGEIASEAEPLLGMSFLEHFKFEIDSAAKKLTMVKVSGTEGASAKK